MKLTSLKVKNFRNLNNSTYKFSDGFNFIIAPNGSGKTNLVESIYILSNGKSFRTHNEFEILPLNEPQNFFRLSCEVDQKGKDKELEYIFKSAPESYRKSQKILKVNDKPKRLKDFIGNLITISFFPTSVDVISGSPIVRRNDLDVSLSQLDIEYLKILEEYKKVVRNRNRIIDRIQQRISSRTEILYWSDQLIELGSTIISMRIEFFQNNSTYLNDLAAELYRHDLQGLSIEYVSKFVNGEFELLQIKDEFKKKINENYEKEIFAGKTLYGPHLEDFIFLLDKKNLKLFGSRGQQRLAAFIYRMAIGKMLTEARGHSPVLLLDDLFSELDAKHIHNVLEYLKQLDTQIILTATKDDYLKQLDLKSEITQVQL